MIEKLFDHVSLYLKTGFTTTGIHDYYQHKNGFSTSTGIN